ncbi:MAG: hypothetical protein FWF49_02140 [Oscillospiraceae bacterium]|nr:hypothetical protein [Oscillospiraceae bacterium]
MSNVITHLAVADKLYASLGGGVIQNLPLFFGGNIAPDAVHAKKDCRRSDKVRSHLCEGIIAYGYGDPSAAQLFDGRVNEFFKKYYFTEHENKDVYLGYIVHLLVDQADVFAVCEYIAEQWKNNGMNTDELEFREKIINEMSSGRYKDFFSISVNGYPFKINVLQALDSVWDYEVKDYINSDEINSEQRWVMDTCFKSAPMQDMEKNARTMRFVDVTAEKITERLRGMI